MKTKSFGSGKFGCKTYFKTMGHGWETTCVVNGKTVFVGNFIHWNEAARWYATMNRTIRMFAKKFTVGENYPASWFTKFLGNHLYSCYYTYLDRVFAQHKGSYTRAFNKDLRKYKNLKKNWDSRAPFYKAA